MTTTEEDTATLSTRQRAKLRSRLVDDHKATELLISRLVSDLDSFQHSRQDAPVDDEHDPEGPTLAFERSQSTAILGQTRIHLSQIESALEHIDGGTYGVCVTCHKPIPVARLEVRPYSTQCVGCASKVR